MRLTQVNGTLSDAIKLKWSSLDQYMAEMLHQLVTSDDFPNLNNWTETDADGKVNLSGGVISMDGANTYASHGLYYTVGHARAQGYFEIKCLQAVGKVAGGFQVGINNSAAVPNGVPAGAIQVLAGTVAAQVYHANGLAGAADYAVATWYTLRFYPLLSNDGTTWKGVKVTVQGGTYTNETDVMKTDFITTAHAATLYFTMQRYTSDGAKLSQFKEFRWYSGYATDGPYVTYTHDAGAGKTFDNFDMTALAMPGTVPSTNLKFDYYFGDDAGGALSGTWRTLAQLNALGKVTGRYRYIKIAVQSNSDGATQVYAAKPNSDTAIDGIGDFPALGKVMADATVQGSDGTLALANVLSGAGGDYHAPDAAEVIDTAVFGPSPGTAGTVKQAATNKVESGYQYGPGGNSLTGSLVATGGGGPAKKGPYKNY